MIDSRAEAPPVLLAVPPVGWLDPIPRCPLCGGVLETTGARTRQCDRCHQRWVVVH